MSGCSLSKSWRECITGNGEQDMGETVEWGGLGLFRKLQMSYHGSMMEHILKERLKLRTTEDLSQKWR